MGFLFAEAQQGAKLASEQAVSSIISDQTAFKINHAKPHITIIVDLFGMRRDISEEILHKLSANIILCVPSHCILQENIIATAQKYKFTLSMSVDFLNEAQWTKMQKVIEANSWIKGLVIWSVDPELNMIKFLDEVKAWLSRRGIWLVFANTNNIRPLPAMPEGIVIADGFVKSADESVRITEQASFVLSQAKFNNRGLLLIQPAKQHLPLLVDWLQKHSEDIQLDNWSQ